MFPVSYYVPSSTIPTIPELKYVWSTSLAPYYVRDLEINIQNQVLHLMKRNAVHDENQRLPTLTPPPPPSVNLFFFYPFHSHENRFTCYCSWGTQVSRRYAQCQITVKFLLGFLNSDL